MITLWDGWQNGWEDGLEVGEDEKTPMSLLKEGKERFYESPSVVGNVTIAVPCPPRKSASLANRLSTSLDPDPSRWRFVTVILRHRMPFPVPLLPAWTSHWRRERSRDR
jgi:hypothetical protein